MSTPSNKAIAAEQAVVRLRKANLIGTFRVFLSQTRNHPDQRKLDQSWVDSLVQLIGSPDVLARSIHPISVLLDDPSREPELLDLLDKAGKDSVPQLPDGVLALVFAGQHRLAMLSQLDLGGPDQLWWDAMVYKKELETNHPAEFITMMHESNAPQVVKTSTDVELFHAIRKLKLLLNSNTISQQVFLQNRRMLLAAAPERSSRVLCSLTRNDDLMNAIAKALLCAPIANTFSVGSWMRLTTGQLYMVAAGLIEEMIVQVDQLLDGMVEIPEKVLLLRNCNVSHIKNYAVGSGKKHAWECLPGGRGAALKRAVVRPQTFVTPLNPKRHDPWTFSDLVLLPSCLGSKTIEDELKKTHEVVNHVIKMFTTEEQFEQYHRISSDKMEAATDHPAGVIAQFLHEKHPGDAKLDRYECKILQRIWASRAELHEQLTQQNIPVVESADEVDYQRLITESKAWWNIVKLFKVYRFRARFTIPIPREFGSSNALDTVNPSSQVIMETPSAVESEPSGSKRAAEATEPGAMRKRVRHSTSQLVLGEPGSGSKGAGSKVGQPEVASEGEMEAEEPGCSNVGESDALINQDGIVSQAPAGLFNMDVGHDLEKEMGLDEEDVDMYQSEGDGEGDSSAPVEGRRGGDRRLAYALEQVKAAADSMTRSESRSVTQLLEQIMESRRKGDMELLVKGLVSKGKRIISKLEKLEQKGYSSLDEHTGGDEDEEDENE
ncbi:hypothetical protein FRC11_008630 [Ceratobasidium sp. 423]|nr:hypothetical protein FRC11_008630 [Ceratobasidium sp. 423]